MTITVCHRPPDPDPELTPDLVPHLTLTVRQLLPHRPGRCGWDLFDSRGGEWFEGMFEFYAPEEAERSGRCRLDELRRAAEAAQRSPCTTQGMSVDFGEVYGDLKRLFAEGDRIE
jgi:hypothetical protein